MERFFTDAFTAMSDTDKESFYKTVIFHDTSDYAAAVRLAYYGKTLKHLGKNVKIGAGAKIVNPQYVSLGDNVTVSDDVTLIARGEGGITIKAGAHLCERVYLDTEDEDDGFIEVGERVYLGTGTTMFGHKGLEIGDDTLIAQNVTFTPYSHIFDDPTRNIFGQGGHSRKVTIGRDCYIGMRVAILYSGDIGEGSIVGAGSVVVKSIPPYSLAVGCPAKVIKKREG